jgi:uncharacterized protein YdaU (DUF1376 family)
MLNDFFTKTEHGWYHNRCEEKLEAYRNNTSQKSAAGKASAARRVLKRQQAMGGGTNVTAGATTPVADCRLSIKNTLLRLPVFE